MSADGNSHPHYERRLRAHCAHVPSGRRGSGGLVCCQVSSLVSEVPPPRTPIAIVIRWRAGMSRASDIAPGKHCGDGWYRRGTASSSTIPSFCSRLSAQCGCGGEHDERLHCSWLVLARRSRCIATGPIGPVATRMQLGFSSTYYPLASFWRRQLSLRPAHGLRPCYAGGGFPHHCGMHVCQSPRPLWEGWLPAAGDAEYVPLVPGQCPLALSTCGVRLVGVAASPLQPRLFSAGVSFVGVAGAGSSRALCGWRCSAPCAQDAASRAWTGLRGW
jgi:hypothetical protein